MICRFCNNEIPDGAAFCGFCGNKTDIAEAASDTVSAASDTVSAAAEPAVDAALQAAEIAAEQVSAAEAQVSDIAGQTAAAVQDITVPDAATENTSWTADNEGQIPGSSVPVQPVQGNFEQPGMAVGAPDTDAAFAAQAPAQSNFAGGKAFDIMALLKNKLFLICAGAVLLLIILIIVIVNVASSPKSAVNPRKGSYYGVTSSGERILLYNGNVVEKTDFSSSSDLIAESRDGTKVLVADGDELTLVDNGKAALITDELYEKRAKLSESGTVVYLTEDSLCVYSGNKSNVIDDDFDNIGRVSFAVSPDGKTVAYNEYDRDAVRYKYLRVWDGKGVIDLEERFYPTYVSNGGKIIYGSDSNSKLTYLKNLKAGSAEKLNGSGSKVTILSADHSRIMYLNESNGRYYLFDASLNEPVEMSKRSIDILIPGNYSAYPQDLRTFYAQSGYTVYRYSRSGDSYESERIVSGAYNIMLSADGKTIVYQDDNEIFKVSVSNPDVKIPVASDVTMYSDRSFMCDPSANHIYYIDDDGDLRYAGKDSKKIASDIRSYYVNESGVCVYVNDDRDMFYSIRGGDKVKISGISDEISNFFIKDNIFYAMTDDEVYVSTDGKGFKKVADR